MLARIYLRVLDPFCFDGALDPEFLFIGCVYYRPPRRWVSIADMDRPGAPAERPDPGMTSIIQELVDGNSSKY